MLVPIVFVLVLLLTLATALLDHALGATKIALRASVARYSDIAASDGVTDFTAALATYVAAHGSGGPWPSAPSVSFPRTSCAAAPADMPCPFSATITSRITNPADGAAHAGTTDAAQNLQTAAIAENRVSAIVTATITAPNGTLLGARTRLLTYRVFEAPPYAIVAGSQDTSTDGVAGGPGDTGGVAPPATNGSDEPPAANGGGAPGEAPDTRDTRIHVVLECSTVTPDVVPFRNDQRPAGNDGLPWGNATAAAYEAPCHQPASPADDFADHQWTNGNAGASGWTP